MFVALNDRPVRRGAVAVDHAPASDQKTVGVDCQAVRTVGQPAFVIAGDDGDLDAGHSHPRRKVGGEIGVYARLEQVARHNDFSNGVSRHYALQRRQNEGKVGRRHGLAVSAASLIVPEMKVG